MKSHLNWVSGRGLPFCLVLPVIRWSMAKFIESRSWIANISPMLYSKVFPILMFPKSMGGLPCDSYIPGKIIEIGQIEKDDGRFDALDKSDSRGSAVTAGAGGKLRRHQA